jgi:aminopeptidase YwaD
VNDINSEYHLCIEAEKFDYRCANIIGVMNPEAEGKKIIVAAHYDTAPGTVGACDNASGTVVLLLLAGILKKKDISERIDFIVFGSEEFGSRMGSSVYVEEHKNELDNIRFMCNLDDLACPLAGQKASIYGPEPFCASVEKSLKNYGILKEPEYLPNGDNKFFYEAGVPNVSIITKAQSYIQIHSPDDNMTKVNAETAMNAVKAVANLVENIIREKVL